MNEKPTTGFYLYRNGIIGYWNGLWNNWNLLLFQSWLC